MSKIHQRICQKIHHKILKKNIIQNICQKFHQKKLSKNSSKYFIKKFVKNSSNEFVKRIFQQVRQKIRQGHQSNKEFYVIYISPPIFLSGQSWFLEAPFVRMLRMRSASLKTVCSYLPPLKRVKIMKIMSFTYSNRFYIVSRLRFSQKANIDSM